MSIDFSQEEAQTTPLMTTSLLGEDEGEGSLRPKRLTEYIGQEKAKENLSVFIDAAKMRQEPLDHVLLHGPPGQNHAVGDHRQRNGGPYPHYLRPGH